MANFDSTVTVARLNELFNYNQETGIFTWRVNRSTLTLAGDRAGSVSANGYATLHVNDKSVLAHRAAWAITYGEWPNTNVDHINGVKSDNRIVNLRKVSQALNLQNQRRARTGSMSGILGVRVRVGKLKTSWSANICVNDKPVYLGSFSSAEEASAAYLKAKRELHPGCTI